MSYYKDLYERFIQSEFCNELIDIRIADEMYYAFDKDSKDFDTLCSFAKEMYYDSEAIQPHDIVWAIYECLNDEENEHIQPTDMKDWLEDNYDKINERAYKLHIGC